MDVVAAPQPTESEVLLRVHVHRLTCWWDLTGACWQCPPAAGPAPGRGTPDPGTGLAGDHPTR